MRKSGSLSVIIPIFNEEKNIEPLLDAIYESLGKLDYKFEVIAVNDGSTDGTQEALLAAESKYQQLRVINFKRNFGQTAAMSAGFDQSQGDIIIPIDSDLQNDPSDIGKLLKKIEEGYDVVSGWRKNRKDHAIRRNFLSKMANKLISFLFKLKIHDYGCTLKAYRKSCIEHVHLYGEMHRFIPVYASLVGARVTEIEVNHHPRIHGESKYGMSRIFKVLLDLMVLYFLDRFFKKPIYLFGGVGFFLIICSISSFLIALWLKFFNSVSLIQTPLPLFSAMTFIAAVTCILMGLLAEIMMRIYFESQGKKPYFIKKDDVI